MLSTYTKKNMGQVSYLILEFLMHFVAGFHSLESGSNPDPKHCFNQVSGSGYSRSGLRREKMAHKNRKS
jgi:hypothetical protein